MRTDSEWIESFLQQNLSTDELKVFTAKRAADRTFRQTFLAQAKVHLAALLYGRNRRRLLILDASEKAFGNEAFSKKIERIFR